MTHHDEVAQVLASMEQAWNDADASAYARLYASDAIYVTRAGTIRRGRRAIEDGHAKAFAGPSADSTLSLRPIHISFPSASVAVVHVDIEVSSGVTHAVATLILALEGDHWLIVAAHTSEVASVH